MACIAARFFWLVLLLTYPSQTNAPPQKNDDKRKVGRKPIFSPRRQAILASFGQTYKDANSASKRQVALFLDQAANWCIHRWGYSNALGVDVDGEDDDPTEEHALDSDLPPPDDDLSEAEATLRSTYYSELRTVSHLIIIAKPINTHNSNRDWGYTSVLNFCMRQ